MTTTNTLLVLLALTLPALAMPHPCEVEVAKMKADLDAIRGAIATFEALRPSDDQRRMLASARGKYDLELLRTTEAQARCERLVGEDSSGAVPSPTTAPATQAAAPATPAVPAAVPPAAVVAPAAAVPVAPPTPAPGASSKMATPCLTGCGKDTDCKGDRICVKGECVDPPARKGPPVAPSP